MHLCLTEFTIIHTICDFNHCKLKFSPQQAMKAHRGSRGITTLSLTLALDEGGWSTSCPGHFTPWKETRYPFYRRLGGPQGRSGQVQKISPPPGFDPRTVQRVASHYTDWAIPAHDFNHCTFYISRCSHCINTFTALVDLSRFNNSCLKSPVSTLVDLTFQSRALCSFSLNQLRNLSL